MDHGDYLMSRVKEKPDNTMPELVAELEPLHAVEANPASLSRFLCKAGRTYKKVLLAAERARWDVTKVRNVWIHKRQPIMRAMPHRLAFINETSTTPKLTRLRGQAMKGERLPGSVPFGHWQSQTFIAALRYHGRTAPWPIDGAMDRAAFDLYVETQLAPTLQAGDVIILDNLKVHESATAAAALKARGAWLLFLPAEASESFTDGQALLQVAENYGLEGVVSKATGCALQIRAGWRPMRQCAGDRSPFDLVKSRELYQALLAPFADLTNGRHLIIVPSGPLTSLPIMCSSQNFRTHAHRHGAVPASSLARAASTAAAGHRTAFGRQLASPASASTLPCSRALYWLRQPTLDRS